MLMAESSWQRKELLSPFITFTRPACLPACLSVSLPSSRPTISAATALFTCFAEDKHLLRCRCIICSGIGISGVSHIDNTSQELDYTWATTGLWREGVRDDRWVQLKGTWMDVISNFGGGLVEMCSRILTFVSRAARGNTESLFLIETSGVWELTEWSLSHRCLSPAHYREALWPLFSPIIRARAPSRRSSITPNSLPSDGTSKPPASYFLPDFISDLWGIETHTEKYFLPISACEVHMPPKAGEKKKDRGRNTARLHCVKTGSQHYASRQTKIWTPWHYANGSVWLVRTWLHTTLLISIIRYSNGWWVRSMQLEQSVENSQSELLIVVLSPHDPLGWFSTRNTSC